MRITKQLENLLKIFYVISVISFLLSGLLVVFFIVFKGNVPFYVDEVKNDTINWLEVSWSLYSTIFFGFLATGVLRLKKAITNISINDYFNTQVIYNFRAAGNTFIIMGFVLLLFHVVSQVYFNQGLYFIIDTMLFCYLFILVMGIFFKLFGNAFIRGKELLEENELTI